MTSSRRKLIETLAFVSLFVIGFTLGAIFGNSRINKMKVSDKKAIALAFMDSRISDVDNIAKLSDKAIETVPELAEYVPIMRMIMLQGSKSVIYSSTAVGAARKLRDGEKVANYEKLFNREVLAYMMNNSYKSNITRFISDADAFLAGKEISEYTSVAFVRDLWVDYLLTDAVLYGETDRVQYWSSLGHLLSKDATASYFQTLPDDVRNIISTSYYFTGEVFGLNARNLKDGSLDSVIEKIDSSKEVFASSPADIVLIDEDELTSCDTVFIDNDYLYSVAVVAPVR